MSAVMDLEIVDLEDADKPDWVLTELKPNHKSVCALLAQGFKNVEIAKMCDITPQYVSMLWKQPLIKDEVNRLCAIAGTRLEALFVKSVDVIADQMENGNGKEKLAAARLQLEATKRIGRPDPNAGLLPPSQDRLAMLAERLLSLQSQMQRKFNNESAEEVPFREVRMDGHVLEGSFVEVSQERKGDSRQESGES